MTFLPRIFINSGISNQDTATIKNSNDNGFVMKIEKSPLEIVKARRILFSIIGPKTRASTRGATG